MEKYEIRDKDGKKIGSIEERSGYGVVIIGIIVLLLLTICVVLIPIGIWVTFLPEIVREGGGTEISIILISLIVTIGCKIYKPLKFGMESFTSTFWSLSISSTVVSSLVTFVYAGLTEGLTDSAILLPVVLFVFSILPALLGTSIVWFKEKLWK